VHVTESTLSTHETALLDFLRAEGNRDLTPSEIAARSPLGDVESLQILSRLVATGVLELRDADAIESPSFGAAPFPKKLGRFEVDRFLGQGSMGAVLLARDPAIDRVVAIKLVQTAAQLTASERDKYRERFYREASAAGQLHHPSIATVYDVGHTEDGTPFLVMEHVKGETLGELLAREKPSPAEAIRIARDVLAALSFAHAQGIVHRDVKPSNIMVTAERRAKIMDFGIAHVMGSELTSGADALGSPYYMAPEQLYKGPISARTDLFSFGVVLYRTLTGVLPFTGDSFAAVAHAILHEEPVPPDRLDPRIPRPISSLVLRCLEKAPEDRAGSAPEVLRALDAAESGAPSSLARPSRSRVRILALSLALLLVAFAAIRLRGFEPEVAALPTSAPPAPPAAIAAAELPPSPSEPPVSASPAIARPLPSPAEKRNSAAAEESSTEETAAAEPAASGEEAIPESATEAELFYEARVFFERGDLEESRATLETLLSRNPTFEGARELRVEIADRIWETSLPLRLSASHKHRLGGCEGELSLASLGVRFESEDHEWAFRPEDIRVMERPERTTFIIETFEKDALSLGKNKRYRFELHTPIEDADWTRYQRLLK
jgi:serine/threonine protein kinase